MTFLVPVETAFYERLEISVDATDTEIKKAYKKKALALHPDRHPGQEDAFRAAKEAYEVLLDPNTRHIYDHYGEQGLGQGSGSMNGGDMPMSAEDIFGAFFGSSGDAPRHGPGRSAPRTGPIRGQDAYEEYKCTLQDLFLGKKVELKITKDVNCTVCKGSGGKKGAKAQTCSRCAGRGVTMRNRQVAPNMIQQSEVECSTCDGRGTVFREKDRCKRCKGARIHSEKKRLEIHIEKGMKNGQKIVCEGEADAKPGVLPGNLIFVLNCQDHETFDRRGAHLLTHVQLPLVDALLGFSKVFFKHLDNRGIRLDISKGHVVRPDSVYKLAGEGMPVYQRADTRGDLFVVFNVLFPSDDWARATIAPAVQSILPRSGRYPPTEIAAPNASSAEGPEMERLQELQNGLGSQFFERSETYVPEFAAAHIDSLKDYDASHPWNDYLDPEAEDDPMTDNGDGPEFVPQNDCTPQ